MNYHQYMTKNKLPILLSFILPLFIVPPSVSSKFHELNWFCVEAYGNYTVDSTYQNNLNPLLVRLTDQAAHSPFGNSSVGEGVDRVNMIYNCRGDLNLKDCHDCVQQAAERIITLCPVQKEAIFWEEECMLRYSNRTIFSTEEEDRFIYSCGRANITTDPLRYNQVVAKTLGGLIMEAAYNQSKAGYALGEGNASGLVGGNKVYCYAQCTPDILGSRCERCLRAALRTVAGVCGMTSESVKFYYPSCQIQYSPVAFIRGSASPPALSPPIQPNSSATPSPTTGGSRARMIKGDGDILMFGLILAVSMWFIIPTLN